MLSESFTTLVLASFLRVLIGFQVDDPFNSRLNEKLGAAKARFVSDVAFCLFDFNPKASSRDKCILLRMYTDATVQLLTASEGHVPTAFAPTFKAVPVSFNRSVVADCADSVPEKNDGPDVRLLSSTLGS